MFIKHKNWSDIISKLCFLIGVILIGIVVVRKDTVNRQQNAFIETYQEMQKTNNRNKLLPDTTQILDEDTETDQKAEDYIPIGILSIPKLDLETAVLEGVTKDTLRYAVGHYENTPLPNKGGNFCVVGHRSYSYGEFFNRLDEMEIGDEIYLEASGETFQYKVNEILVVEPEDTWVLENTSETMITLITCTPIRVGTQRLIVRAILET